MLEETTIVVTATLSGRRALLVARHLGSLVSPLLRPGNENLEGKVTCPGSHSLQGGQDLNSGLSDSKYLVERAMPSAGAVSHWLAQKQGPSLRGGI